MSFPGTIPYEVTFNGSNRATINISGTPGGQTIEVLWNGANVYGPTDTNEADQANIPATYVPGSENTLRVQLTDGGSQPYSKGGIDDDDGSTQAGALPQV